MENKSFLSKFLLVLIIIVLVIIITFFLINKNSVANDMKEIEKITSMNVDTYDEDLYIYKLENNTIFTSPYFYNAYYLSNNEVTFTEYKITDKTKFYFKTLSNTEKDINNIKITYDPIDINEFNYILNNYNLLKVYIWKDSYNNCKNVLLYSSNNVTLEVENY